MENNKEIKQDDIQNKVIEVLDENGKLIKFELLDIIEYNSSFILFFRIMTIIHFFLPQISRDK